MDFAVDHPVKESLVHFPCQTYKTMTVLKRRSVVVAMRNGRVPASTLTTNVLNLLAMVIKSSGLMNQSQWKQGKKPVFWGASDGT
jgi:hypothetical protein